VRRSGTVFRTIKKTLRLYGSNGITSAGAVDRFSAARGEYLKISIETRRCTSPQHEEPEHRGDPGV